MSDARDRLRHYLEQRREMGESEFVLDTLSVEDALRLMARDATAPTGPARASGGPPPRPDSAARRAAAELGKDRDWRAALRGTDATDATPTVPSPPPAPQAPAPALPTAGPRVVGANAAPSGLVHLADLGAVAGAIAGCTACTLAATARNHVPGEGSPTARFVVVGEAPGATEDELGRPFVGKSGDLLTKILEAIQFKREDVFICNVLKHRPPGNRNPTRDEIVACRPFLLRQLELLQPKVILALGTFAAQTLLETDSPIGKLRGIEHRYHGIPLVATYHPAALLRNPNWKRPAWEDVQLARRIFDRA
ncbi:MAG: uracil-DNA glycosylase [Gemmatimonadaceae bacterium]